jgi:hypothetical protein
MKLLYVTLSAVSFQVLSLGSKIYPFSHPYKKKNNKQHQNESNLFISHAEF